MRPATPGHRALRFVLTGVLNTVAGLAVIVLTRDFVGLSDYAANAAGYAVGLGLGFALNRSWTFEDRQRVTRTAPRYALAFALSYAANVAVLHVCLQMLALDRNLAQIAALATYSATFFVLCRRLVFQPPT